MRIAITYNDGNIFEHFGRTEYFKLYDIKNNKIIKDIVISSNGEGHSALALILYKNNVNALICGGIGNGAINFLKDFGIKVYAGVTGSCDKAVDDLLNGTLVYSETANCNHHDHDSECDCK